MSDYLEGFSAVKNRFFEEAHAALGGEVSMFFNDIIIKL